MTISVQEMFLNDGSTTIISMLAKVVNVKHDVAFANEVRDVAEKLRTARSVAISYELNQTEKTKYRLWIDGEEL